MTPEWMWSARCKEPDVSPATFFPYHFNGGRSRVVDQAERQAKVICSKCRVRTDCLEYALELGPRAVFGVWGGTTPDERAAIQRARTHAHNFPIRHGTDGGYQQHNHLHEPPCTPCQDAHRRANQLQRDRTA